MSSLLSFNAALVADFSDAFDRSWKSVENHIFFAPILLTLLVISKFEQILWGMTL